MGDIVDEALHSESSILRLKTDSGTEDVHYPVFYEGFPEEFKLIAEHELGETPAKKEKGLRKLKEFMEKENLSCTDDDLLLTVLRSCKYDLKKSESKLRRFLNTRRSIIKKLYLLDNKKIDLILEDTLFSILPYRDRHGRAVLVTKPSMRLDLYSIEDIQPVVMSLVLYMLSLPITTVCGMSYIGDCKCDSILVFYPILKSIRSSYIYFVFDMPMRYGRVDILNENVIVRFFYNVFRLILPEKISKRIFFHGDSYKSLHSVYPPDILPEDFEGKLEPMNNRILRGKLLNFFDKLKEEYRKTETTVT